MIKKLLLLLLASSLIFPNVVVAKPKLATLVNPSTGHRKVVVVGTPNVFSGGYVLEVASSKVIGSALITGYKTTLSSSMTSAQATVPVSSMKTVDNHTIVMTDIGSKAFLTIEPGSAKQEIVMCTNISGNSWTGCTRGLAFYGTSTIAAGNAKTHAAGSAVVMSNVHYVYDNFTDKDTSQTIDGVKTFTSYPKIATSTAVPTNNGDFANKYYVDNVTIAGGVDASSLLKGISKLSTNPSSTTNPIALNYEEVATTTGANKVVRASSTGKINQDFLDIFGTSNTWTNSNSFSGTTNMATTSFSVNPILSTTTSLFTITGAAGTSTITHNLGKIPYLLKFTFTSVTSYAGGNDFESFGNSSYSTEGSSTKLLGRYGPTEGSGGAGALSATQYIATMMSAGGLICNSAVTAITTTTVSIYHSSCDNGYSGTQYLLMEAHALR